MHQGIYSANAASVMLHVALGLKIKTKQMIAEILLADKNGTEKR